MYEQVKRYLDLVDGVGPLLHAAYKPARAHLFKLLYPGLLKHMDLRDALVQTSDLAGMRKATEELASRGWEQELHAHGDDAWLTGSWCVRRFTAFTACLTHSHIHLFTFLRFFCLM